MTFLAYERNLVMDEDFERMCSVVASCTDPRLTSTDVPHASLDELLRECARRITSDNFFLQVGRRLFSDYFVVRAISKSMYGWLFEDDGRPTFFV
jgi:hypothetical protein